MYKKFYGLTRNPFEVSPDPYFFFQTPRHTEALANLAYGVLRRKGFVVVTGEVGTGKTLLVRCLLEVLSNNKIAFAYVYNPMISVPEFLTHVVNDLGLLPSTARSKSETVARLNNFLMERSRQDLTTALVVDEAQLLSWELLEEIRLLTNLETTKHKLLQIVLVGQPEFDRKLDSEELRQLKQRIALRCSLKPLGRDELKGYIYRRLELAGAASRAAAIFPDETIASIYHFSRGIPRLINTVCENSLLLGLGHGQRQITCEIVREVAADLHLDRSPDRPVESASDVPLDGYTDLPMDSSAEQSYGPFDDINFKRE
jgi:type II secretory pathway predicted ATPase ExeA